MYKINDHVVYNGKEWFIIEIWGNQSSYLLESLGLEYDKKVALHCEIEPFSFKHIINGL